MSTSTANSQAMDGSEPGRSHDWRKRFLYGAIIAVLVIIILMIRSCHQKSDLPFDYFRAKAIELKQDPTTIKAFARNDVKTLAYRGNVKGALATLWNGAGSPEEKKAMAQAILAFSKSPDGKAPEVTLDDVAPARDKTLDSSADATTTFTLTITHRIIGAGDNDEKSPIDTVIYSGPTGGLVGDVHTISCQSPGHTTFTLRARANVNKDVTYPQDAISEQVVFTYMRPTIIEPAEPPPSGDNVPPLVGPYPPVVVTRELWHDGNRVGASHATPGDRHEFVVLPAHIKKFVREKEEQILKEHMRSSAAETRTYLMLLDYALQSDKGLASLEKHRDLIAQFDQPRILIASRFVDVEKEDGVAWALDLRANRTSFYGPRVDAYLATQARSFMEAGLEQKFLSTQTGLPSTSTFDVFSRLKDEYPNTCARRLELIRDVLVELQSFSAVNASATFAVHISPAPAGAKVSLPPPVSATVTRSQSGRLHLKGGTVKADYLKKLAATPGSVSIPTRNGNIEGDFTNLEDLAVAVETALLSTDCTPSVSPDYVLDVAVNRGTEPLVEPGSRFRFTWGEGERRTDEDILVNDCGSDLTMKWRVQTSVLPAAGTRTVVADTLANATIHNPWYRAGSSSANDATSFCVSRKVYNAIKSGQPIDLAVQAKLNPMDPDDAKRTIEYTAPLTPLRTATHAVLVNGKKQTIPVIVCKLKDSEVAILDDPTFPVGMADKLTVVTTGVRGRLIDDDGVPISGATLKITSTNDVGGLPPLSAEVTTAADGSFRLRPPTDLDGRRSSYGQVKVVATIGDFDPIETTADFTTPGLDVVDIRITRPRPKLVYISKSNAGDLDGLDISDEVKRIARRDINAGELVVIPDRMLTDGVNHVIGYFACDRTTGNYIGVTEEGLNGSNEWEQATKQAVKDAWNARQKLLNDPHEGASAPFNMFRGAVVSWWVYCGDRLAGDSNKEALCDTLAAMQGWSKALNLSNAIGATAQSVLGKNKLSSELTSRFTSLINSGIVYAEGDSANAAFEIGYVSGTAGLAALIGDDDSD